MSNIFIATSSLVAIAGDIGKQSDVVEHIKSTRANGIEIREELFQTIPGLAELEALGLTCREAGLEVHYSSPQPIWHQDGSLNTEIKSVVTRANSIGARLVKMSLGNPMVGLFDPEAMANLKRWLHLLEGIQFTVENDQTPEGGRMAPLRHFLEACAECEVPIQMTFDIGNWSWTGEDVVLAAHTFVPYVAYVHVKDADTSVSPPRTIAPNYGADQAGSLLQTLKILPKQCPRCIEYSLVGYTVDEIHQNVVQLRDV